MARLARAEVFNPNEVAILHVIGRVVRRCFLLGNDPVTGKNYDHRKIWIEDQLKHLAANFGIDLLSFAILSNRFHLILRSRPDVVEIVQLSPRMGQAYPGRRCALPWAMMLKPVGLNSMETQLANDLLSFSLFTLPVFRHREAMAKGKKEGIRPSDHQRAIAQLEI